MPDSLRFLLLLLTVGVTGFAVGPATDPVHALPATSPYSASECPPDRPEGRSHVERYLTSSNEVRTRSRAAGGLAGVDPSEIVLVTDPALCAFVTANLREGVDNNPDWAYVYYRHPATGRILTVAVNLDPIRPTDDPWVLEGTLTSEVITVYSPQMAFLTGILQ